MRLVSIRPVLAAAVVAALCFATAPRPVAAPKTTPFERLLAKALDPSDKSVHPANIDIVIERWSTDEESDSLLDTLMNSGADTLDKMAATLQTLQHTHLRAGIMELPGFQGLGARASSRRSRIVQFARDIATPSGRQVIVALDHPVTIDQPVATIFGTPKPPQLGFDGLMVIKPESREFQLIDIRFGPDGTGIGKVATAGMLTYNTATRTIELANFGMQPVRLTDVISQ
jgi:hypothetical protein